MQPYDVCFIPARNSSTRFKNKNVAMLNGKTLLARTIEQAYQCDVFDRIIVSSNDESILNIVDDYYDWNIEKHFRDDSQDQLIGVLRQSIPELKLNGNDSLCLLLVTCPLRTTEDIYHGYRVFENNNREYATMSVRRNVNPIQMSFEQTLRGHLEPAFPNDFYRSTRKQDHVDTFYYNDAFIYDTVDRWLDENRKTLYGHNPIPVIMPWERSIAIDYEFQLNVCKALLKEMKHGKI